MTEPTRIPVPDGLAPAARSGRAVAVTGGFVAASAVRVAR